MKTQSENEERGPDTAAQLSGDRLKYLTTLALRFNIYAYDAYYLQCCIENKLPLLSLDGLRCNPRIKTAGLTKLARKSNATGWENIKY